MLVLISLAAVAGLGYWLWGMTSLSLAVGVGMVIGGALGNLIDRLVYGRVADFFHFYGFGYDWYVFNVADIAITLGAVAIIYEVLKPQTGRLSDGSRLMRSKLILRLAVAGLGMVALAGCETLRDEAGLTKQSPDEFAVTTKAPLDHSARFQSAAAVARRRAAEPVRPHLRGGSGDVQHHRSGHRGGADAGQLLAGREDAFGECRSAECRSQHSRRASVR